VGQAQGSWVKLKDRGVALWQADAVNIVYDPHPDGLPDPGEVVWTWVAYEDDPTKGKDRPVVLIAREADHLVGLMLTSKDHDRDMEQEAHEGRFWFDVGSGPWDPKGRPSEVRLNRLLVIDPGAIRREGSVLDRARFESMVAALGPYLP
jgi:PemK-like, MazF-like toxin of type II toxin-antitoxin system